MSKLGDTVTGARVLGTRMAALQRESNPEGRMPLMDHLRELRNRVVKAAAALLVGTAVGLIPVVFNHIWSFVVRPFCSAHIHGVAGCRQLHHHLTFPGFLPPFIHPPESCLFSALSLTPPPL